MSLFAYLSYKLFARHIVVVKYDKYLISIRSIISIVIYLQFMLRRKES